MSNTNTEVLTTAYEKLQGALTQSNTVLPKLEEAVEKGNLDNYATVSQLEEKANEVDLQTQKARIDSFTSLAEGSTTGDAELTDGRVGADGITYSNIGGAIRGQINNLDDIINDTTLCKNIGLDNGEAGWIRASDGEAVTGTNWYHKYLDLNAGDKIYLYSAGYDTNVSMIGIYENNKHKNKVTSTKTDASHYTYTATEKCTVYISYKASGTYFCKLSKNVVSISDVKENMLETTRNKFNKETIKTGFIDSSGTLLKTDDTLWYSEFIDIGTDFTISWTTNPSDNLIRIAYYNEGKEFVKRDLVQVASNEKEKHINNSSNYKYIIL